MKNATFYLLEHDTPAGELRAHEALACEIAAERWRAGKRVLIACESQEQAQRLDEALWQRAPEQFVPHNLAGEGPNMALPSNWRGRKDAGIHRATCLSACCQNSQVLPPLSMKW